GERPRPSYPHDNAVVRFTNRCPDPHRSAGARHQSATRITAVAARPEVTPFYRTHNEPSNVYAIKPRPPSNTNRNSIVDSHAPSKLSGSCDDRAGVAVASFTSRAYGLSAPRGRTALSRLALEGTGADLGRSSCTR